MNKEDIKKLLMKVGPLLLGAAAFVASSIADAISQKNEEEYINERVAEEVKRQLGTPDEEEPVEDNEDEMDEESDIEIEEP